MTALAPSQNGATTPIAAARHYAETVGWLGFPVHYPTEGGCSCGNATCDSSAKHPACAHGLNDATADREALGRLWNRTHYNVGLRCGAESGVFVLDVDPRHGGDKTLAALIDAHGPLPQTVHAHTGGGGSHYFFRHPGGKVKSTSGLRPGLDVKGDGGYVVLPPSRHAEGGVYRWADGRAPAQASIADAPDWLLAMMAAGKRERPKRATAPTASGLLIEQATRYVAKAEAAAEGGRNEAAFSLAGHVAAFVTDTGERLCEAQIVELLRGWNLRNAPPLEFEELEAAVHSAVNNGTPRGDKLVGQPASPGAGVASTPTSTSGGRSLTDLGNAERLVDRYGDRLRYVGTWHRWYAWDNKRWRPDETGVVQRLAQRTVRGIFDEAKAEVDQTRREAIAKWAIHSEKRDRLNAMVALGATQQGVAILHDVLDRDPWLLNCENGTVDLRTGALRPHDPADLITKSTGVDYPADAGVDAPLWTEFLETIFAGDYELIGFVQRLLGASLVAKQLEHVLPIFHGAGGNGKGVCSTTVLRALGDYGMTSTRGLLMVRRHEAHPTELADLHGKRLVFANETDDGQRLNESLVKAITGGDNIRARRMREDHWEFPATHTLVLVTNHKPVVRGSDNGIWRRLRLIPFDVTIAKEREDPNLDEKLRAELPAVLRWMVDGCLAWQQGGLREPQSVLAATDTFKSENDTVGRWLADCCDTSDPNAFDRAKRLRESYAQWCDDNGEKALGSRTFGEQLTAMFAKDKDRDGWFYRGVELTRNQTD